MTRTGRDNAFWQTLFGDCRNLVNRQSGFTDGFAKFRRWPKIFPFQQIPRALGLPQKLRLPAAKEGRIQKNSLPGRQNAFVKANAAIQSGWCDFFSFREDIRKCGSALTKIFCQPGDFAGPCLGQPNPEQGFVGLGKNEIFILRVLAKCRLSRNRQVRPFRKAGLQAGHFLWREPGFGRSQDHPRPKDSRSARYFFGKVRLHWKASGAEPVPGRHIRQNRATSGKAPESRWPGNQNPRAFPASMAQPDHKIRGCCQFAFWR